MISETSGQLRRVLGVGFGLAVSIGGTIGVGILRTPGLVADNCICLRQFLYIWMLEVFTPPRCKLPDGVGPDRPRAGGFYVYVRRAFGNTAGFAVGWTDWLMYLFDPRIFVDSYRGVHCGVGSDTRGRHSNLIDPDSH